MATLTQIRDAADAWLALRWPTIQLRQTTYALNHGGRFWQGKISHTTIPVDSVDAAADLLNDHPTDQIASWNDAINGALPISWPCALVMNVYDGPLGQGYVATVYVQVSALGKTFSRSQQVGPETWRNVAWHEVVLGTIV